MLVLSVVIVLLGACASKDPRRGSAESVDFAHDLSVCRFQHSGRTNRKLSLKPTDEHIARCLARRGWSASGERVVPGGDGAAVVD